MAHNSDALPIVVGLGDVDPSSVNPALEGVARFVREPEASDLAHAVGAIVRAHVNVDQGLFAQMPQLKVLARTGVGTERVDLSEAARRGIPVVITPGSNTTAVAEGSLAHLLALTKSLTPLTALVREGRWSERASVTVDDLAGGTLAILGYGRIGRRVAGLAGAFGMSCLAYDPYVDSADIPLAATLEEAVATASHITVHLPATPETAGLINRELISTFQPGTILVNLARGEVLDLDAALWGLNVGHLGGVGLDVFDAEPPAPHPLFDHPQVILSPHVMGLTTQSTAETFRQAALGVADVLSGRKPAHQAAP